MISLSFILYFSIWLSYELYYLILELSISDFDSNLWNVIYILEVPLIILMKSVEQLFPQFEVVNIVK